MRFRLSDADRASPSATYKLSSNVVRVAGRVSRDRWLVSIFFRRRVRQARSQRQIGCRATSSTGNWKCQWTVGNAKTITRREILHCAAQRLKLTEQQSWRGIAQSKGMAYLQRLPEAIPEGQFLVHNSVRPTHPLGSHGFRAWLQVQDEHLEPCDCGWTPELGTHYRVKLRPKISRYAEGTDPARGEPAGLYSGSREPTAWGDA
jgi:hypothetical protein